MPTVKRKRMRTAKYSAEQMQRTARYYTAKAMVISTESGTSTIETINLKVYALSKDAAIKDMKKAFPEAVITEIQGHIAKFVMPDEEYFNNSQESETVDVDDDTPVDD